jgi:SAM-dependent methyltransferase
MRLRLVRIDPPGTWLQNEAILDLLKRHRAGKLFLEVGCGAGELSRRLLQQGYAGKGLDLSAAAVAQARTALSCEIAAGRYRLHHGSVDDLDAAEIYDCALSIMVIEHIPDDVSFIRTLAQHVRSGGFVVLGVPGRKDRWCLEDETVGHLRRYDKEDLMRVMSEAGLEPIEVWSVSVPIANLLFHFGNRLIEHSDREMAKRELTQQLQTLTSGIREIPFKTVFPVSFRLILNRWTLWPFFILQRLFYSSKLGITLVGIARSS